ALLFHQRLAYPWLCAHPGRRVRHLRRADLMGHVAPIEPDADCAILALEANPGPFGGIGERGGVGEVKVLAPGLQSHGAIHRARIEIEVTEALCHTAGRGALPRASRAADGNDEAMRVSRHAGIIAYETHPRI